MAGTVALPVLIHLTWNGRIVGARERACGSDDDSGSLLHVMGAGAQLSGLDSSKITSLENDHPNKVY